MTLSLIDSILFLGLGVFLFRKGFYWFKQKHLIENMPTSKIRSIAMGLVEIFGEVLPAEKKILKSPLTNKDCVYYRYIIEEYHQSGKHSNWSTIKKDENGTHFYLKDKTGSVLVDPKGAKIDIPKGFEFTSSLGKDPPKSVKKFLEENNMSFEGFLGINKKMRFREFIIKPKDELYIMGTAGDNPFVEEATAKEGVEDVMIQKGKREKFYYISNKPERDLLVNIRLKSVGGILGGAGIIIYTLAAILINLGLL